MASSVNACFAQSNIVEKWDCGSHIEITVFQDAKPDNNKMLPAQLEVSGMVEVGVFSLEGITRKFYFKPQYDNNNKFEFFNYYLIINAGGSSIFFNSPNETKGETMYCMKDL